MNTLIKTITTAISNTVLFAAAIVMAGLGFVFVGTLALFALMAVGVAMIASPFVALAAPAPSDAEVEA